MNPSPAPSPRPQRLAAAWFLGIALVGLLVFAWLRGAGRILLPVLLAGALALLLVRALRAIVRPLP